MGNSVLEQKKMSWLEKKRIYELNHRRKNQLLVKRLPNLIVYSGVMYYPKWQPRDKGDLFELNYISARGWVFVGASGNAMKFARAEVVAGIEIFKKEGVRFKQIWQSR